MKVLELFSGTHSIGNVCHELGWEVVSLDRDLGDTSPFNNYKSEHNIKEDIMTWDYKKDFKKGEFDIITASPVCLWWSRLRDTWIGRKMKCHEGKITTRELLNKDIDDYGKPMVDKVFEIIEYFKPQYWWIENPETGKMKHYISEKYVKYNTYYIVDYCKYSNWGYQKKTRIWTNIKNFTPLICKKDCENIITIPTQEGAVHTGYKTPIKSNTRTLHKNPIGDPNKTKDKKKHRKVADGGYDKRMHKDRMGTSKTVMDNGVMIRVNSKALREKYKDYENLQMKKSKVSKGTKLYERYRIPEKLIEELLLCII